MGQQLVTVTSSTDLQIVAASGGKQLVLTTPEVTTSGDVTVTFTVQYVNMIPQPGTSSNGISFTLWVDGQPLERMGLFGNHNTSDNMFAPITLINTLDGARALPPGKHTFSMGVAKWQAGADGYLVSSYGMPMRLTVNAV